MQVSTVIGAAIKSQREEAAWTEGVAIWVAVAVVSLVGDSLTIQTASDFEQESHGLLQCTFISIRLFAKEMTESQDSKKAGIDLFVLRLRKLEDYGQGQEVTFCRHTFDFALMRFLCDN